MSEDSLLKLGITEAKLQAKKARQQAIEAAEKAVVEAAKKWYNSRPASLAVAPIALAVQTLLELEAKD